MGWSMAKCQSSCDNCFMRRYKCAGFEKTSPWLRVILACLLNFLTGGVIYGWSALQQVYKEENVSADLCSWNETLPCAAQEFYLGLVFSVASTGNMCAGLPMGLLVDLAGPRIAFFVSEVFVVVGAVFLGFGDALPRVYLPAFLLLGIGGTGVQVSLMHTSALFPKQKSNVTNAIHACFQLSFLIFAFFQFLYDSDPQGITSSGMFLGYSAVALLSLIAGLFWPARAYGGHGKGHGKREAAPSIVLPPGGFHNRPTTISASRRAAVTTYATQDSGDSSRKAALIGDEVSSHHPGDYHLAENGSEDDDFLDGDEDNMVVVNTMGVMSDKSIAGNQQRLVSKSIAARNAAPSVHAKPEFDPVTATFKQQVLAGHLWACVFFITIGIVFSNSFIATLGERVWSCFLSFASPFHSFPELLSTPCCIA